MPRNSCIAHKPKSVIVFIHEDYLRICEGDHCAAAILKVFEYWTNVKLDQSEQAKIQNEIAAQGGLPAIQDTEIWIYKSKAELKKDDLLNTFGETKIAASLNWLEEVGFLQTRHNPNFAWDRTLQYRLNIFAVQDALDDIPTREMIPFRKNTECIPQNHGMETVNPRNQSRESTESNQVKSRNRFRKNTEAIPETPTEITTETPGDSIVQNTEHAHTNESGPDAGDLRSPAPPSERADLQDDFAHSGADPTPPSSAASPSPQEVRRVLGQGVRAIKAAFADGDIPHSWTEALLAHERVEKDRKTLIAFLERQADVFPPAVSEPIREAVRRAFGWDPARMTDDERGQVGKAAKELLKAGYEPEDVGTIYAYCAAQGWSSGFGPMALVKHASAAMSAKELAKQSGNGGANGRSGGAGTRAYIEEHRDDIERQTTVVDWG